MQHNKKARVFNSIRQSYYVGGSQAGWSWCQLTNLSCPFRLEIFFSLLSVGHFEITQEILRKKGGDSFDNFSRNLHQKAQKTMVRRFRQNYCKAHCISCFGS